MSNTTYLPEIGAKVAEELSKGRYLKDIADEVGVNASTILMWAARDIQGFRDIYARAREAQMEAWSHELTELADSATDKENVNSVRLRIDTRKWLMARIYAKRYGDKVGLTGADGISDIVVRVLPAQAAPKQVTNDLAPLELT